MFGTMKKSAIVVLALVLGLSLLIWGCQKKGGEEIDVTPEIGTGDAPTMPDIPEKVEVPPEVAAKWKAVVLEVEDKDTKEKKDYTVKIGDTAPLGNTGLTVTVEAFLPSFQMAGGVYTSASNDLNNPAARVKIVDKDGKELYYRWLFSLYPTTHPMEHPKYSVVLKSYVENK